MDFSDGCTLCHSELDLRLLSTDAAPDDLLISVAHDPYDHWAPHQWAALWRQFAPRLIALVADRAADPGLVLRSLGPLYGNLRTWPDDERRAIEDALTALLLDALAHWPSGALVELLGGLASTDDDLAPWLARIDAAPGAAAAGGVVRLAFHWAVDLLWGEESWFDWWYPDDPEALVREWTSRAMGRVERFAEAHPGCKTARDALVARDHLERGEQSPWIYPSWAGYQWEQRGLPRGFGYPEPRNT
ncbi:hypothetical protein L6E12_08340 [Actinokineospora sp. PR83]|uniref:hypothetical protein n=1 Tax=Actinokineospora sp. PR83 TaxID=2884908 RepID=UPI001F37F46C|nr:hypothetical protein [Actinokineospora sp. PR83]MCG8915796.1 hypothetical protein [Actinokineospora sp. PR83]